MLNRVELLGRLGADPEETATSSGMVIVKMRIATDRRVKNGEEWTNETDWHRVTVFGRTAENCAKFLRKGRQVFVDGRLQYGSYEKEGVKHYTTDIIANDVKFIGGKGDSQVAEPLPVPDEDLPF